MHRCLHTPIQLREVAHRVEAALSVGENHTPGGDRTVRIGDESLVFPYRVYYTPGRIESVARSLEGDAKVLALCLASRHHDGRIREAAVKDSHFVLNAWSTPFAIQLLGEYVVEIGIAVEDQISKFGAKPFIKFARENQPFMETTLRRAISYWDCYHRNVYKNLIEYPCYRALQSIHAASSEA
jgi:hypothetical protein